MSSLHLIESVTPCSGRYSLKTDLRLNGWLAVATLAYLAQKLLLQHHPDWSPAARAGVALSPLLPGLLYVRSWLRFIRGLDELQRRVQLEAFLFAALGTTIVSAVLNTLGEQGAVRGALAHGLNLGGVFVVLFTLWLVGGAIAGRRFR